MHVPDGFLNVSTSIATGVVSIGVVGYALRRVRAEMTEAAAPLAGLTAAFVFAVQMLNFPVGIGTSGHLMGGALAAALVGPWMAVIVVAVVLAVQALLFADGGITALGSNVLLIGIVTVAVGYAVSRLVVAALPRRALSAAPAAAIGALISVPAAALVFVGLYAVGGATELPLDRLAQYMLGWHTLIGVGEAVITGLTVAAVAATRPDLVHLARGARRTLVVTAPDGTTSTVTSSRSEDVRPATPRVGRRTAAIALVVSLALAGIVSGFASANPDGLEYVAESLGFIDEAQDSAVAGGPLSDYGLRGIDNPYLSTGLAGVIGVLVVVGLGILIARLSLRASDPDPDPEVERIDSSV